MNKFLLSLSVLFFSVNIMFGATGDTLVVKVHDHVDMTWNGNYDETGFFPTTGKTWHKVIMQATIGCASGGCSDWDYTVNFLLRDPLGVYDSTIASIDTFAGPIYDTTWNVFQLYENYELGRMITPYGGYMAQGSKGFDNSWEHRYRYDVTDFAALLEDSVEIRSRYSGWSSGFDVTFDFYFIEGTPYRDVLGIDNIFYGSKGYSNNNDFNQVNPLSMNVLAPAGTKHTKVRFTPSGHGFDNNANCAEFCDKEYYLKVNNALVASGNMWKDDCGMNALYPQGGTWVLDRANWCPGEAVPVFEHELGTLVNSSAVANIDIDLEDYNWSGTQQPSHIMSIQSVYYGDYNFKNDAELEEIIAPSSHEDHGRFNPICGNPIVRIKNTGGNPLVQVDIKYGAVGAVPCHYQWTGNLAFGETADVTLPTFTWTDMDDVANQFYAEVSYANDVTDEYSFNNRKQVSFEAPPMYPEAFELWFRTNTRANENEYFLFNESGDTLKHFVGVDVNTLTRDTFNLDPGCYRLEIIDRSDDGMTDWPMSQGTGLLRLRQIGNSTAIIKNFEVDFGTRIMQEFMVGYDLASSPAKDVCDEPERTGISSSIRVEKADELVVWPNPAQDKVFVQLPPVSGEKQVNVLNIVGQEITSFTTSSEATIDLNTSSWEAGFYIINVTAANKLYTAKVLVR